MSALYRISKPLFKEKPQITRVPKGVREDTDSFCISGKAEVPDKKGSRVYYLYKEELDGDFYWRRDLWKQGEFASLPDAQRVLEKIIGKIRISE